MLRQMGCGDKVGSMQTPTYKVLKGFQYRHTADLLTMRPQHIQLMLLGQGVHRE
jgi:hypothetical protein